MKINDEVEVEDLVFPAEAVPMAVYKGMLFKKLGSPHYKPDAVEESYVLKDTKCSCDEGVKTFTGVGRTEQHICGDCKGVGYTTEKILLSSL